MELHEVPQLVEKMGIEQPNALSFLLAAGTETLSPDEHEVVFFIGVMLWHVIDTLGITISEIPMDLLYSNEEKNYRMLEYLAGEPETEFMATVSKIMEHYNQSVLLRYVIDAIIEEQDNEIEINENHIGIMVIYLKTFIDCLDAVI